jgi:hypothetical protein
MDTEEMIKAQPVDVCVMIGGCDKTVPAQLMGGISANKPVLPLVVGPMMPGSFKGTRIGACTDCRNNWASYRTGEMDIEDIADINYELAPTVSVVISLRQELLLTFFPGWYVWCYGDCEYYGVYHCCSGTHAFRRCISSRCVLSKNPCG